VWFDGYGRALRDGENRLVAVEGILTDITDRKLAAEQIATLARSFLAFLQDKARFGRLPSP